MAEKYRPCIEKPLCRVQECPGLLQTLSVSTSIESYTVQVCPNPVSIDSAPRFHETVRNGTGTVVVHQLVELSDQEAISIAEGFDL